VREEDLVRRELFYHYTSIDAFCGILSSGAVWATDSRFLNDQKELRHAFKLFASALKESKHHLANEILDWHNYFWCHCVFSMSRSPEVLSQWRAYGDDGYGVALGIVAAKIAEWSGNSSVCLVECIYTDHEDFIRQLIVDLEEELEKLTQLRSEALRVNSLHQAIRNNPSPLNAVFAQLLRVKNSAFQEEKEVRLVFSVDPETVALRARGRLFVPYVEHKLLYDEPGSKRLEMVVPEVWLGPKCDERNVEALQLQQRLYWTSSMGGIRRYDCSYV